MLGETRRKEKAFFLGLIFSESISGFYDLWCLATECCGYWVTQLCSMFCNPMDCSTPGFPILHYLWEFAQTHVHDDGHESMMSSNICCPLFLLLSIFPTTRVFSNELGLHIWCQSIGASASASVLPMNMQGWFPLGWTVLVSLQSRGLSRGFFSATVLYYI